MYHRASIRSRRFGRGGQVVLQYSQGRKHGSLAPVQSGRLVCDQRILAIIKVAAGILHVPDRPMSDFFGDLNAGWMQVA